MKPVIWSPEAQAQLREQGEWLALRSAASASRMIVDVLERSDQLGREIDRGRPGRFEGTRECSIPKWHKVLVYRRSDRQIDILAIIHTRMKPPDKL